MMGMVNGLKSPGNHRRRLIQSVSLASKISFESRSSITMSWRCLAWSMDGLDGLACRCHIFHQAHFCLAGKGLWWHALMDSQSKWSLTTSREGRAKKLEEERSSFVVPLKVRGVFGRPVGRGRGHYLASPKERKKENNFRRLNAPNFPFRSSSSSSSSSVVWHGCCQAAKSALCLSWTDRLLCLLGT